MSLTRKFAWTAMLGGILINTLAGQVAPGFLDPGRHNQSPGQDSPQSGLMLTVRPWIGGFLRGQIVGQDSTTIYLLVKGKPVLPVSKLDIRLITRGFRDVSIRHLKLSKPADTSINRGFSGFHDSGWPKTQHLHTYWRSGPPGAMGPSLTAHNVYYV